MEETLPVGAPCADQVNGCGILVSLDELHTGFCVLVSEGDCLAVLH